MASLYEIEQEILSCLDSETGEIVDIDRLQALTMEREQKIENVALWYKNLLSDAEAFKKEKDAFAEKEKAAKNKAESLKRFLDSVLSGNTYKSTRVTIGYRKSEQCVIDDISVIPSEYLKPVQPEADKTAIKAAIKAGAEIAGAHIEVKNNIGIK